MTTGPAHPTMIESCSHCGQDMDVSAMRPFSNAVCPACAESSRVLCNMGVYRITGKIGIGGMSVVYRAEDTILGREVALKVLNETYGDQPERIAKFEDEARIMARVQHDHMVKIYSVGQEWGCFYIAMELVDGQDLETYVREHGPLPEPQALQIASQVADGLDTAWQAGMLHRDIKPANILLDKAGVAKVVDFGLSLLHTQQHHDKEVWATPYYASPETLEQKNEDYRSDMYALGCSLFQLLVGKPPFEEIPQSIAALLDIKKKLPPLQRVAPDISPATSRIINRLMAYSPSKRYDGYGELIEDIRRAAAPLHDEPGRDWSEKRRTLIRRAARTRVRNRILAVAGGLAVLALAVFGVGALLRDSPIEPVVKPDPPSTPPEPGGNVPSVQVGVLYADAEAALERGDIPGARRYFSMILDAPQCPLSTYAWASLQSALCSWCLGSLYEGDSILRRLTERLDAAPQRELTEGVRQLSSAIAALSATQQEGETAAIDTRGVTAPYYLTGLILKSWHANDYRKSQQAISLLERESQSQDVGQSRAAGIWLRILKPYIADAQKLAVIDAMPETGSKEIVAKLEAIRGLASLPSISPGIALRQSLKQMETRVSASLEHARQKENLDRKNRSVVGQVEVLTPDAPWSGETVDDAFRTIFALIGAEWNFDETSRLLDQLEPRLTEPQDRARMAVLREMTGLAGFFVDSIAEDIPRLALSSRTVSLKDGTRAVIRSLEGNRARIENDARDAGEINLSTINPESLILLHRDAVAGVEKNPELARKRHVAAVVFLYLAGEREKAQKAAAALAGGDPEFARDWKRWMLVFSQWGRPDPSA